MNEKVLTELTKFIGEVSSYLEDMARNEERVETLAPKVAADLVAADFVTPQQKAQTVEVLKDPAETLELFRSVVRASAAGRLGIPKQAADYGYRTKRESDLVYEEALGLI